MATLYVWSGAGSTGTPYASWGAAALNLTTAAGAAAAGDTIYIAHDHAEVTSSAVSVAFTNATGAAPISVICGTRTGTTTGDTGISALASTASVKVTTTGALAMTSGLSVYIRGVIFENSATSGTNYIRTSYANSVLYTYDNCDFILSANASGQRIVFGFDSSAGSALTILKNCRFKFAHASQLAANDGVTEIYGGSIIAGGTTPTTLFQMALNVRGSTFLVSGFDASGLGAGVDLLTQGNGINGKCILRNMKLPAAWSGEIHAAAPVGGTRYELLNYGTGDTNYKFWTSDVHGQCRDDTSVYRDSGAADESPQPYSIKMITTANVAWPGHALRSQEIRRRVVASGSPQTVTVHIAHNGTNSVNNNECWLEIEYLGTSGFPLATFSSDMYAVPITGGGGSAAQPDSGASWTGDTGAGSTNDSSSTTWHQLTLDVPSITFAETGYLVARVHLAKPSWTIWVDPKIVLS